MATRTLRRAGRQCLMQTSKTHGYETFCCAPMAGASFEATTHRQTNVSTQPSALHARVAGVLCASRGRPSRTATPSCRRRTRSTCWIARWPRHMARRFAVGFAARTLIRRQQPRYRTGRWTAPVRCALARSARALRPGWARVDADGWQGMRELRQLGVAIVHVLRSPRTLRSHLARRRPRGSIELRRGSRGRRRVAATEDGDGIVMDAQFVRQEGLA